MTPPGEDQLERDPEGWAAALLAMHGLESGPLEPMEGWSNRLWGSGAHVVRVSSGRFDGSLSYEPRCFARCRTSPARGSWRAAWSGGGNG